MNEKQIKRHKARERARKIYHHMKCVRCLGTGKDVDYPSPTDGSRVIPEDCPKCEGKGYNLP